MRTLSVLISCMYQRDWDIVVRSNVQTDCVVVNQCDCDKVERYKFTNKKGHECNVVFISTLERGLSRSRNMAIRNATSDICLICDDDETLCDNYEDTILGAYSECPKAGIIAFALDRKDLIKVYPTEKMLLGFRGILKTSSLQISFRRVLLKKHNIMFDEKMGSGTGNGGGEENKFMFDCRKAKFEMRYFPKVIATVNPGQSQWFHGYDEKFMVDKGWAARRIFGGMTGFVYLIYFAFSHHQLFKDNFSQLHAFRLLLKGWKEKR